LPFEDARKKDAGIQISNCTFLRPTEDQKDGELFLSGHQEAVKYVMGVP
jgi:hypothetical protein